MDLNHDDGMKGHRCDQQTTTTEAAQRDPPPHPLEQQQQYCHDEPDESIVGLCPAFWAHVPLTIRQVHELKLWNGMNCLVRYNKDKECTTISSVVPLSKCELVGLVVAVESRGGVNGGVVYVIDDGTGLIDCLHWPDDDDAFGLPSLTDHQQGGNESILTVGTMARIYGRIEVIAMTANNKAARQNQPPPPPFVDCIREIHASIACDARQVDGRPCLGGEDVESQHWKRCVEIPHKLLTSQDIIHKLGPKIAQQIAQRESLPSADDSDGAWRVFGSRCTCNLPYKHELLYCHCQATRESFDPEFQYRDALLKKLLDLEQRQTEKEPLRFQYKAIKTMSCMQEVAKVIAPSAPAQQSLILGTFRALRKDGIIYLMDEKSDTYLLISRGRVLEPYLQTITSDDIERGPQRAKLRREPPAFLQLVPKTRLRYVRRNLKKIN